MLMQTVEKGFDIKDGPFVKGMAGSNRCPQNYNGGILSTIMYTKFCCLFLRQPSDIKKIFRRA